MLLSHIRTSYFSLFFGLLKKIKIIFISLRTFYISFLICDEFWKQKNLTTKRCEKYNANRNNLLKQSTNVNNGEKIEKDSNKIKLKSRTTTHKILKNKNKTNFSMKYEHHTNTIGSSSPTKFCKAIERKPEILDSTKKIY